MAYHCHENTKFYEAHEMYNNLLTVVKHSQKETNRKIEYVKFKVLVY
jgi:hypothetical protein